MHRIKMHKRRIQPTLMIIQMLSYSINYTYGLEKLFHSVKIVTLK